MGRLDDAQTHVETAKRILESSSIAARFSWLSSYCAYRAGDVAMKQGRNQDAMYVWSLDISCSPSSSAIASPDHPNSGEHEKAVAIGTLTKVPTGILCRCIHALSKALETDPSRLEEAETKRLEARRLRSQLPHGGGDLDDESDAAFESLVKMDHR